MKKIILTTKMIYSIYLIINLIIITIFSINYNNEFVIIYNKNLIDTRELALILFGFYFLFITHIIILNKSNIENQSKTIKIYNTIMFITNIIISTITYYITYVINLFINSDKLIDKEIINNNLEVKKIWSFNKIKEILININNKNQYTNSKLKENEIEEIIKNSDNSIQNSISDYYAYSSFKEEMYNAVFNHNIINNEVIKAVGQTSNFDFFQILKWSIVGIISIAMINVVGNIISIYIPKKDDPKDPRGININNNSTNVEQNNNLSNASTISNTGNIENNITNNTENNITPSTSTNNNINLDEFIDLKINNLFNRNGELDSNTNVRSNIILDVNNNNQNLNMNDEINKKIDAIFNNGNKTELSIPTLTTSSTSSTSSTTPPSTSTSNEINTNIIDNSNIINLNNNTSTGKESKLSELLEYLYKDEDEHNIEKNDENNKYDIEETGEANEYDNEENEENDYYEYDNEENDYYEENEADVELQFQQIISALESSNLDDSVYENMYQNIFNNTNDPFMDQITNNFINQNLNINNNNNDEFMNENLQHILELGDEVFNQFIEDQINEDINREVSNEVDTEVSYSDFEEKEKIYNEENNNEETNNEETVNEDYSNFEYDYEENTCSNDSPRDDNLDPNNINDITKYKSEELSINGIENIIINIIEIMDIGVINNLLLFLINNNIITEIKIHIEILSNVVKICYNLFKNLF